MRPWSAIQVATAACLLAVAPLTSSQQSADRQGTAAFRARSDLVLIPVVVTDASGKYARNLRQEDFIVREDGKEQTLSVFEPMLAAPPPTPTRPQPTATEFTNAFPEQARPGHLIILALDTISTSLEDQGYARAEMIKFVQSAAPGTPMALVSLRRSEVKLLHDFTTDPKALATVLEKDTRVPPLIRQSDIDELEKLRGELEYAEACAYRNSAPGQRAESQGYGTCTGDQQYWKTQVRLLTDAVKSSHSHMGMLSRAAALDTLDGFQELAHAFAGVPGRKSLIWATGGFPFTVGAAELAVRREWFGAQGLLDLYSWYQRTWQVLNDANTVLYPVDARGLVNSLYDSPRAPRVPTTEALARADARHNDRIATMQIFAQMTGGVAFFNRNDLDAAFASATEDTASYYLLGYYKREKSEKAGWRKLKVDVKVPALRVRARSGFFLDEKSLSPEATRDSDFELALRSPLDYTGLKLRVPVRNMEDKGASKRVTFSIKLHDPAVLDTDNANHFLLQYVVSANDESGKLIAQFNKTQEGRLSPENARSLANTGMYYDIPLDLPPGQYRLRFVVRDNLRGVIGSVSGPFTVPHTLAPMANLPVASQPAPQPTGDVGLTPRPQPPSGNWGPPDIDAVQPAITPGVSCSEQQVLGEVGRRLGELVDNISQFDAIEEVVHEEHDRQGRPRLSSKKKFTYLATISRPRPNVLKIDEERQSLSVVGGSGFPGGIATLGLPSLVFAFHPSMRDSFVIACEGLGEWQGQPTWVLHFRQREFSPSYLQAYNIGGQSHAVALMGRAWVDAGTFQILHMEAGLVRSMPSIQLLKHHQAVDYGLVTFKQQALWLPKKAELYFHFRGHRYYRRHTFENYRMFAVDVTEKVKLPTPQEDPP